MTREKEFESIPIVMVRWTSYTMLYIQGLLTSKTAHKQDAGESNKDVHQGRTEERVDVFHYIKANVA